MFTFVGFLNQIRRRALFNERMEEGDRKGQKVVKNVKQGIRERVEGRKRGGRKGHQEE